MSGMAYPESDLLTPEALVAYLRVLPADYYVSRLPNSHDDVLLAVCVQLLHELPAANRTFAAEVDRQLDKRGSVNLSSFVYRVAMLAVRQQSRDNLKGGFVALALGLPSDIGVLHENMAVLHRSALHLELDPNSLFTMAVERTGNSPLAQSMTRFKEGSASYKHLSTFYLKETNGPSGIMYLSTLRDRRDKIPQGWL